MFHFAPQTFGSLSATLFINMNLCPARREVSSATTLIDKNVLNFPTAIRSRSAMK